MEPSFTNVSGGAAAAGGGAVDLEPLAPGLWGVTSEAKIPGGARLPLRMTVVALPDGDLALHSPVAFTADTAAAIARLGTVKHVIAPSALHHLFVKHAVAQFPQARVYAPPALAAKRLDFRVDEVLQTQAPSVFSGALEGLRLEGTRPQEMVFLHKQSGSLLVTDLVFNITQPQGWATKLVLRCTGTCGKLAQSRLWNFYSKDKSAFRRSTARMLGWDFDRLVPCHGEVVPSGAKQALAAALRWQ